MPKKAIQYGSRLEVLIDDNTYQNIVGDSNDMGMSISGFVRWIIYQHYNSKKKEV